MIGDLANFIEVTLMTRIIVSLVLIVSGVTLACTVQAEVSGNKLIPVKPSYTEAAYVPQSEQAVEGPAPPSPREQMYLFWILGQVISYPIDRAESYISNMIRRLQSGPEVTPAAAQAGPNPFTTINMRQIPPAPPVLSGPDSTKP